MSKKRKPKKKFAPYGAFEQQFSPTGMTRDIVAKNKVKKITHKTVPLEKQPRRSKEKLESPQVVQHKHTTGGAPEISSEAIKTESFEKQQKEKDEKYLKKLKTDKQEQKIASFDRAIIETFKSDLQNSILLSSYAELGEMIWKAMDEAITYQYGEDTLAEILTSLTSVRDEYFVDLDHLYKDHTDEDIRRAAVTYIQAIQGGITELQEKTLEEATQAAGDIGEDYEDVDFYDDYRTQTIIQNTRSIVDSYSKKEPVIAEAFNIAFSQADTQVYYNIALAGKKFSSLYSQIHNTVDDDKKKYIEPLVDLMLGR